MMQWVLPALASGMIRAYAYDINRTHQIDGRTMNFWRIVAALPIIFLLALFVPWPTDPMFYLASLFFGGSIGIGDAYLWKLAAESKSRISTMFGPLNSFGSFIFWLVISPVALSELWSKPYVFVAVCLCYALLLTGIWQLRRCSFSWPAIKGLLIFCTYNSACIVFVRIVINRQDNYLTSAIVMVFCAYLAGVMLALLRYTLQERSIPKLTKAQVKPTALMGGLIVLTTVAAIFSYSLSPNPGYALALVALAPMWLAILHKRQKVVNESSLMPIMLILFSAIGLTLLANS